MSDNAERERTLARQAMGHRLRLEKSRRRSMAADEPGGYLLSDPYDGGTAVLGGGVFPFTATLDEIETYLTSLTRRAG